MTPPAPRDGGRPVGRPEPPDLFNRLEPLLARVSTPVQYVGGEVNSVRKPWRDARVHWVLCYPDAYSVGQPNQGLAVLYELLNENPLSSAERSFAVWPDLERAMREHGLPQFTLEGHRPMRDFDVLGFSLATELDYTNLLNILDLAGLAIRSAQRGQQDPLVVIGGHCAVNPEPIADFVDVVVMGDGEQAVGVLSRFMAEWLDAGRPGGKDALLENLARTGDFYVPRFYDVSYSQDGRIARVSPNRPGLPLRVRRWVLTNLDDWPYPRAPIVPLAQTVHERYSVEIFRGCTRGCRFCQAGMITRPVRERSIDVIGAMVADGLAATGLDEVGLLSLSSADHSEIAAITTGLADRYQGTNTSLSLPSTRVDAFNVDLAKELARNGRRSGLTFAPEGGSERLRAVINKNVTEDDLIDTVSAAFGEGWRSVKLYFMCGLPTETDDDVVQIARLAHRVIQTGRQVSGHRDITCTISIGAFVPKADTPFQWAGQTPAEVVDHRLRLLREAVRADRECGRAIRVHWADPAPGMVEGLLARGDRRVGAVIEQVWRSGGVFDGWREYFDYGRWLAACQQTLSAWGVDLDWYTTRQRGPVEVLPWDHLDAGLDRNWLWADWQAALSGEEVPDCRWAACNDCGVCPDLGVDIEIGPSGRTLLPLDVTAHST